MCSSYTYDENGNVIGGRLGTLTWDHANRLTTMGTVTFEYDAAGRRTRGGPTSTPSTYLCRGQDLIRAQRQRPA